MKAVADDTDDDTFDADGTIEEDTAAEEEKAEDDRPEEDTAEDEKVDDDATDEDLSEDETLGLLLMTCDVRLLLTFDAALDEDGMVVRLVAERTVELELNVADDEEI
jgi:hypothetical protein